MMIKHLNLDKEYVVDHFYEKFNCSGTSIYQILIYMSQREMAYVFQTKYKKWIKYTSFLGMDSEYIEDSSELTIKFMLHAKDRYKDFYKCILRGQVDLIKSLYFNKHLAEGNLVLRDLLKFTPRIRDLKENDISFKKELDKEYLTAVLEVVLYFYEHNISMHTILADMRNVVGYDREFDGLIAFYRVLFIKATEVQDIKLTITLSYDLMRMLKERFEKKDPVFGLYNTENRRYTLCLGQSLYILLSCATKSIELGYTQIAGFLVKFIVSNFDDGLLAAVLCKFDKREGEDRYFGQENDPGYDIGINSFNINKLTGKYCLQKLVLLLFGQQRYVKDSGLHVGTCFPAQCIDLKTYITSSCFYVFKKMQKENYGLFWLSDSEDGIKFREKYEGIIESLKDDAKKSAI